MDSKYNIIKHHSTVSRQMRETQNKHRAVIVWFTGLSGSGKSTLAHAVEEALYLQGCRTFVLDGDNVRHGLCDDLGFSNKDRTENIRRVGEAAKLFMEAGVIVLTAFISPFQVNRNHVRETVNSGDFIEIYCDTPMEVCEHRDVKGLYGKARAGLIEEFTGVSSPYEVPINPEVTINTSMKTLDECVAQVITELVGRKIIKELSL